VEQRTTRSGRFSAKPITEKQINGQKWYSIPNIAKMRPGKTLLFSPVFHNVPPGTFEAFHAQSHFRDALRAKPAQVRAGDPGLTNQEMFLEEYVYLPNATGIGRFER
jgi:hypothetical protein